MKSQEKREREKMQFIGLSMKNITGKINIFRHKLEKIGRTRNTRRIQKDVSLHNRSQAPTFPSFLSRAHPGHISAHYYGMDNFVPPVLKREPQDMQVFPVPSTVSPDASKEIIMIEEKKMKLVCLLMALFHLHFYLMKKCFGHNIIT